LFFFEPPLWDFLCLPPLGGCSFELFELFESGVICGVDLFDSGVFDSGVFDAVDVGVTCGFLNNPVILDQIDEKNPSLLPVLELILYNL
jgi:hypothetical protein